MDTKMDLLHSVIRGRLEFFRSAAIYSPLEGAGFENSPEGFFYYSTGLQHPLFNGVISDPDSSPSDSEVENAIQFFTRRKLPFSWWTEDSTLEKKGFSSRGQVFGVGLDISAWQEIPEERPQFPLVLCTTEEQASAFVELSEEVFHLKSSQLKGLSSILTATTKAGKQFHYMATHEGTPIGIITLSTTETTASVWNIATLPEFRNRGVASALLQGAIKEAQERKYDHVVALVTPESPAKEMFMQFGFQVTTSFSYQSHS